MYKTSLNTFLHVFLWTNIFLSFGVNRWIKDRPVLSLVGTVKQFSMVLVLFDILATNLTLPCSHLDLLDFKNFCHSDDCADIIHSGLRLHSSDGYRGCASFPMLNGICIILLLKKNVFIVEGCLSIDRSDA